ncbi:protein of unknown function [Streptomyces sp. KY75]|nr:protein of unknown function [Streptomyces sp. KY75]CAD5991952.1 protein of unknown function [Streptomyces sp. KY70]
MSLSLQPLSQTVDCDTRASSHKVRRQALPKPLCLRSAPSTTAAPARTCGKRHPDPPESRVLTHVLTPPPSARRGSRPRLRRRLRREREW